MSPAERERSRHGGREDAFYFKLICFDPPIMVHVCPQFSLVKRGCKVIRVSLCMLPLDFLFVSATCFLCAL